jgi:hypothetical protein
VSDSPLETQDGAAQPAASAPRRNWGGVVIAVTGAALVLATALDGISRPIVDFPTNFFGPIFGIQLGLFVLTPIALVVGFAPLAFGARGLIGIAGPSIRSRLWLFGTAIFALIAQYTAAGLFIDEIGQADESAITRSTNGALVVLVFALLVGLVAGSIVARVRIATGLARWSLIIAIVLVAVSVGAGFGSFESNWTELPYAVGILLLGLSYWRVGLVSARSGATE